MPSGREEGEGNSMATMSSVCITLSYIGRIVDQRGPQSCALKRWRRIHRLALSMTTVAVLAVSLAPGSAADATAKLKSAVDAARDGACPSLQSDPVLDDLAHRNTLETESYILHTARYLPFDDAQLLQILRDSGHSVSKAKLLAGYGDVEHKAIYGLLLQGYDSIPDCTYTKYGVNELTNDSHGYVLTAVVLAGA